MLQRRAGEMLHHEVRTARPPWVDAVVGYRNDVGVLQSSERRGLGAKSCEEFRAVTGRLDDFVGDFTLQAEVICQIDDAHSAVTERASQFVFTVDKW